MTYNNRSITLNWQGQFCQHLCAPFLCWTCGSDVACGRNCLIGWQTLLTFLMSHWWGASWYVSYSWIYVYFKLLSVLTYINNLIIYVQVQNSIIVVSVLLTVATSLNRSLSESSEHVSDFCSNDCLGQKLYCQDGKYSVAKTLFNVILVIFNYFGRMTRRLPRLELLIIALTFWQICKSYSKHLQDKSRRKDHEVKVVLDAYEELKRISGLICNLVGEMLISEIAEDVVYFSLEVQLRLRKSDWFSIFVTFETWLMALLAYFIAACAAEQVSHHHHYHQMHTPIQLKWWSYAVWFQ